MKTTAKANNNSSRSRFEEEEDYEGDVEGVGRGASQTRSGSPTDSDSSSSDSDVSGASSFNELFDDPDPINETLQDTSGPTRGTLRSRNVHSHSKDDLKNDIDHLNSEVAGGLLRDRQLHGGVSGPDVEQTVRRVWKVGNVFPPLRKDRRIFGVEREDWMGAYDDLDDSWKVFMSGKTASIICPPRPSDPRKESELTRLAPRFRLEAENKHKEWLKTFGRDVDALRLLFVTTGTSVQELDLGRSVSVISGEYEEDETRIDEGDWSADCFFLHRSLYLPDVLQRLERRIMLEEGEHTREGPFRHRLFVIFGGLDKFGNPLSFRNLWLSGTVVTFTPTAAAENPGRFLEALTLVQDSPHFALWHHPAFMADPSAHKSPNEIANRTKYRHLVYQKFFSASVPCDPDEEDYSYLSHLHRALPHKIPIVDPITLCEFSAQASAQATANALDDSVIFPPMGDRWDPLADPYIPEDLPAMSGVRANEDGGPEIIPPLDLLLEATEKFKNKYVGFRNWVVVASRKETSVANTVEALSRVQVMTLASFIKLIKREENPVN